MQRNRTCNVTMTQSLSVGAAFIFGVAVYNSILGAPECGSFGRWCDSVRGCCLGKDDMIGGAEPNQPNTIHGSCADGNRWHFPRRRVERPPRSGVYQRPDHEPRLNWRVSATVWVAGPTTQDRLRLVLCDKR